MIDPGRLALAREIADGTAGDEAGGTRRPPDHAAPSQHRCHACGGAVDLTRDIHCPHCHAPVLRHDTAGAVAAATAALAAKDANAGKAGAGREPGVAAGHAVVNFAEERRTQRLQNLEFRLAVGLLAAAIGIVAMVWYRQPSQRVNWSPQQAPLLAYSERFKDPFMACDPKAARRNEVRVRQLVVTPGEPGLEPAQATYGAMRAAQLRAAAMRNAWHTTGAFEELQEHNANPYASARSMPPGWFRRGDALPAVERAAFCLAIDDISPPLLADDGFHVIQVVEAR